MLLRMLAPLCLTVIAVACTQSEGEPAGDSPPQAEALVAAPTSAVPTNVVEPQPTAKQLATEPPTAEQPTVTAMAEVPETSTVEPVEMANPEPTEMPAPNGQYEGTYFRGSAAAPITMIDYSDFL